MAYSYIKRNYKFEPEVGRRVRHTTLKQEGEITPEDSSCAHYVQVQFDGREFSVPCHPMELAYTEAR